ncbi:MAG: ribonuclease D [Rhodospirillales bacterium]|nr:MAG: ribonuclease D [Rhodospirillales bacterium]
MDIKLYLGDLPDEIELGDRVAVDTETMGLNPHRDRLCLVQLSSGNGVCHLVQIPRGHSEAPNLRALLESPKVLKLFHFARFDLAMLRHHLGIDCRPVYCTKIASKLARTYTDRHGLKDLCKELLNTDISKQQQSSDWGAKKLSKAQLEYAAADVLYLHRLQEQLDAMLAREDRTAAAQAAFDFLPVRAQLDLAGWADQDIFAHS